MRFDPLGAFAVRRIRTVRRERKAMAADYRLHEATLLSLRLARIMAAQPHRHVRAFSERWDSAYCADCGAWLEPECGCGPDCEYSGRPSTAHPVTS